MERFSFLKELSDTCRVFGKSKAISDMRHTPLPLFLEGRAQVPSSKRGFRGVFHAGNYFDPTKICNA
jgi:hypothetical protein